MTPFAASAAAAYVLVMSLSSVAAPPPVWLILIVIIRVTVDSLLIFPIATASNIHPPSFLLAPYFFLQLSSQE